MSKSVTNIAASVHQRLLNLARERKERLRPADLRTVLREIDQRANGAKTIERIVAETENRSRLLYSRIPEDELGRFLVDIKGQDLLDDRTLRRMLALRASESELDELHVFPPQWSPKTGH